MGAQKIIPKEFESFRMTFMHHNHTSVLSTRDCLNNSLV